MPLRHEEPPFVQGFTAYLILCRSRIDTPWKCKSHPIVTCQMAPGVLSWVQSHDDCFQSYSDNEFFDSPTPSRTRCGHKETP
jgi:hypothetical protein